jgi:hypothetical protein
LSTIVLLRLDDGLFLIVVARLVGGGPGTLVLFSIFQVSGDDLLTFQRIAARTQRRSNVVPHLDF